MKYHVVQILSVIGVGCHATLLRYRASDPNDARDWGGCGDPSPSYQNLSCDAAETLDMGAGLIIAGQGGSATRAAQDVVQAAGTHAFAKLDNETLDSCAARFGDAFWWRERLLEITRTVDFKVEDLFKELRDKVERSTCTTLAILKEMLKESGEWHNRPWALKDPWLRFMLPLYTSNLDVKFLHVTRDVRNIQETHDDEALSAYLAPHMPDVDEYANFGYQNLPQDTVDLVQIAGKNAFSNIQDDLDEVEEQFSLEAVQKYSMFARVWAIIELTLYQSWTRTKPERYFHLSETHMLNPSTNRNFSKKLSHFLGEPHPTEETVDKMVSVYQPENATPERKNHWKMMQAIVEDPSNGIVREALEAFGYHPSRNKRKTEHFVKNPHYGG